MMATVGFVGLGKQGAPIARRIARRFPVLVWARRPEACAAVPAAGRAGDPAELGRRCAIACLCVSGDDDVMSVGEAVGGSMAAGGVVAVHSTVSPATVIELAGRLARRGVPLLDAPVSGGPQRAETGEMAVMVGGEASALARVRPILESFAALIEHLGPVGAGQTMKLINNGLFFANAAVAASAMRLAREAGLDRAAAGRVIDASTGASTAFRMLDIGGGGLEKDHPRATIEKDLSHVARLSAGFSDAARLCAAVAARFTGFLG